MLMLYVKFQDPSSNSWSYASVTDGRAGGQIKTKMPPPPYFFEVEGRIIGPK